MILLLVYILLVLIHILFYIVDILFQFALHNSLYSLYILIHLLNNDNFLIESSDLDLAKAIYSKIKESHPDIDDETARKYFEIALDNIRKIKVNDERKVSRAKRLSLSPKFNKWTGCDVSSY